MESPILIAHRGYAKKFPENTLVAIEAALDAGACSVEFDVQFTKDCVPILLHDANLKRTTGTNKRIVTLEHAKVCEIEVNEAKKHPKKFGGVGIPTLASAIELFVQRPSRHAFVEIKQESIDAFGIEKTIRTLATICQPIIDRCTLIGYDDLALRCSRAMGFKSIGWILKKYNEESLIKATELAPDFLFCNHTKIPKKAKQIWPGPWQWVFYEVAQVKEALRLMEMGVTYLETMAIAELLKSKQLKARRCLDD
jgi:glycerophosphoryl diester phosphodiesterase